MKIVYIDTLELTHISVKETFKENKISVFKKLNDFVNTFDVATVRERQVIIIDIPINIDENIDAVKKLITLRFLSDGNLKIVLFTDYTKIRYGFYKALISPDLTINKKTNLDGFRSTIKKIFKQEKTSLHQDNFKSQVYPTLTNSEFRYIMSFLRGKSIKEISRITSQGIKVIYTHRRNIFVKYNFKNVTEFHSALTYE